MSNYKTLNPTEKERQAAIRHDIIQNAVPTLEKHKNAILREIDKIQGGLKSQTVNRSRFSNK